MAQFDAVLPQSGVSRHGMDCRDLRIGGVACLLSGRMRLSIRSSSRSRFRFREPTGVSGADEVVSVLDSVGCDDGSWIRSSVGRGWRLRILCEIHSGETKKHVGLSRRSLAAGLWWQVGGMTRGESRQCSERPSLSRLARVRVEQTTIELYPKK